MKPSARTLRKANPNRHADDVYLVALGERVRKLRMRRGMTRKILARDSEVSERYIAQLEAGHGNISILLLRQLAQALDTPLESVVLEGSEPPIDLIHTMELLRRLPPEDLASARRLLVKTFGGEDQGRRRRIALIGLRGAGKSTLGRLLAKQLGYPFIELDAEVERQAGAPLSAIFELYGQPGFRRLEKDCLDRIIRENDRMVLTTGGGIVSDPATFERLLVGCYTIWLKAAPAEHMARVMAQGDARPMANNREAMSDLRRILREREDLYAKADAAVDTSRKPAEKSLQDLIRTVKAIQ